MQCLNRYHLLAHGLDPVVDDPDGDGLSNYCGHTAGLDPRHRDSTLLLTNTLVLGISVLLAVALLSGVLVMRRCVRDRSSARAAVSTLT